MFQAEVRQVWEDRIAAYQASGQSATDGMIPQLLAHQLGYSAQVKCDKSDSWVCQL